MKIKISALLGLIYLFIISCYMNYAQRLVYYPEPPDFLYDQMILVLQDLDYTITTEEKTPTQILTKNPFMIAKKEKHKAMITFKREQTETVIEIHISQTGEKVSKEYLEKQRDEIAEKFEERIKK